MPLDIGSATAIVQFTGLGILCFNDRAQRAENLFIHEDGHKLTVNVYKPVSVAEDAKRKADHKRPGDDPGYSLFFDYWYLVVSTYANLPTSALNSDFDRTSVNIDVRGAGIPAIGAFDFFKPTIPFSRTSDPKPDAQDFRWMTNLQDDNVFGSNQTPVAIDTDISKLFIRNAKFFTAKIAQKDGIKMDFKRVLLVDDKSDTAAVIDALQHPADFGWMASDVGAAIDAEQVVFKLTIGRREHVDVLDRVHKPHIIHIENNAVNVGSDIPVFRKFWEKTVDPSFDLLTQEEIDGLLKGGGITGRVMCNGVFTDDPKSIEPFIGGGNSGQN